MKTFTVPAQYAPEIEAAIKRAVDSVLCDHALRDGAGPFGNGFIEADRVDFTRSGELVITIEEADTTAAVRAA